MFTSEAVNRGWSSLSDLSAVSESIKEDVVNTFNNMTFYKIQTLQSCVELSFNSKEELLELSAVFAHFEREKFTSFCKNL